jgi:hypothetical protein
VTISAPRPGEIISYSYLWADEYEAGREEGVKDRPCAVVMSVMTAGGETRLIVLPITHRPPSKLAQAMPGFFLSVRDRFLTLDAQNKARHVTRTE